MGQFCDKLLFIGSEKKFLSIDNLYFSFACVKWVKNFPINRFIKQVSQYICKTSKQHRYDFPKDFGKFLYFRYEKWVEYERMTNVDPPCPKFGVVLVYLEFDKWTMGKNRQK